VLIAGKGHESWQEIGRERLPFSDVEVAQAALEARCAAAAKAAPADERHGERARV
jgi:hypothetical protein